MRSYHSYSETRSRRSGHVGVPSHYIDDRFEDDHRPDLHAFRRKAFSRDAFASVVFTEQAMAEWDYAYHERWSHLKPEHRPLKTPYEWRMACAIMWAKLSRCKRWLEYRENQKKNYGTNGKAKEEDQKWPEEYELVFIEANCLFPPMDRGHIKWPFRGHQSNKALGRNELLALYMEQTLGIKLCPKALVEKIPKDYNETRRKFISSHIQQMRKKYCHEDPTLLRYFGRCENHSKGKTAKSRTRRQNGNRGYSSTDSDYRPESESPRSKRAAPGAQGYDRVQQSRASRASNVMEPKSFRMWITPTGSVDRFRDAITNNTMPPVKPHTFTQSFRLFRRPDVLLTDMGLHASITRLHLEYPTTNIIHFEASLSLLDSINVESCLKIDNELKVFRKLRKDYRYNCQNRIFEDDVQVFDTPKPELTVDSEKSVCYTTFFAEYWAKKIDYLMRHRRQDLSVVQRKLGSITIVQDILIENTFDDMARNNEFDLTAHTRHQPRLAMIFFWTFREAEAGTAGMTSWRNVVGPATSPSALESTVRAEDGMDIRLVLPSQPAYHDGYDASHQPSLDSQSSIASLDQSSSGFDTTSSFASTDGGLASMAGAIDDLTLQNPFEINQAEQDISSGLDFSFHNPYIGGSNAYFDPSAVSASDGSVDMAQPYFCSLYSTDEMQSHSGLKQYSVDSSLDEFGPAFFNQPAQFPYQQHLNEYTLSSNLFSEDLPELPNFAPAPTRDGELPEQASQLSNLAAESMAHDAVEHFSAQLQAASEVGVNGVDQEAPQGLRSAALHEHEFLNHACGDALVIAGAFTT